MSVLTCAPAGTQPSTIYIGGGFDLAEELDANTFLLADEAVLAQHTHIAPRPGRSMAIAANETAKTLGSLERVLREMVRAGLDRRARLVVMGGGTLGDLGGLAAALFMRGIDLVHVPTTLLAMLDSSVGGKTAVNLPEGKNLVGHVWPATRVLIDPRFITTLSNKDFSSGIGEALKIAIGLNAELFDFLSSQQEAVSRRDEPATLQVIEAALRTKIRIVEQDPFEHDQRRLLNLGHTLGHALEAHSDWRLPHGHCVARGIHFALRVSQQRGDLTESDATRCRTLLERYGFSEHSLPPASELRPFMSRDKKAEGTAIHFVAPHGIGKSAIELLPVDELLSACHSSPT